MPTSVVSAVDLVGLVVGRPRLHPAIEKMCVASKVEEGPRDMSGGATALQISKLPFHPEEPYNLVISFAFILQVVGKILLLAPVFCKTAHDNFNTKGW